MTGQQIDRDRLRALAENATPGPWHWDPPSDEAWPCGDESLRAGEEVVLYGWGYDASGIDGSDEDRAFIAAARTAVPALLDMLDQAEQRIRDLTQDARDERAACLDQIEQVQARDARIQAVRDVLDRARDEFEQPDESDIRRALDGDR